MKDLIDDRERQSDTAAATDAGADRPLCIVSLDRRTFCEMLECRCPEASFVVTSTRSMI